MRLRKEKESPGCTSSQPTYAKKFPVLAGISSMFNCSETNPCTQKRNAHGFVAVYACMKGNAMEELITYWQSETEIQYICHMHPYVDTCKHIYSMPICTPLLRVPTCLFIWHSPFSFIKNLHSVYEHIHVYTIHMQVWRQAHQPYMYALLIYAFLYVSIFLLCVVCVFVSLISISGTCVWIVRVCVCVCVHAMP